MPESYDHELAERIETAGALLDRQIALGQLRDARATAIGIRNATATLLDRLEAEIRTGKTPAQRHREHLDRLRARARRANGGEA